MQMFWNKRNHLHKKRVHLQRDWFGTPTWPPFHCFGTPIWPTWRHVKTHYKQFGFCGPEQKLDEGTITAAGYSGKVHFCYPAGYRNTGSVHGNFSVLLAKFVKRGRFERKVFWGTRFGCIWSGKALRGNAYFSSLIAFDEGERFLFIYRTRSSNRSVCHAISGFGRHLGPAWHTLPRSHVFSFSRPGAGIYFVTLVHRWNFGDFLFTTGLFMVLSQFSIKFFIVRKFPF